MKTYIKVYWFLLVFFAVISNSFAQTVNTQENNDQSNTSTNVQQQNTDENINSQTLDMPGETQTGDQTSLTNENEPTTTTTQITPEKPRVNGTRLPNEYASGRTGGQMSNTGVKYAKITSPKEMEKRIAENSKSKNIGMAEKSTETATNTNR